MIPVARTAKARRGPSRPCLVAIESLTPGCRVLDHGCGRGANVLALLARGFDAVGWDPTHHPVRPVGLFDAVFSFYVLNVLTPDDRPIALADALSFLRPGGRLYVSYRDVVEIAHEAATHRGWRARADGWITGSGTFQAGISPDLIFDLLRASGVPGRTVYPGGNLMTFDRAEER
jgi:hypothetical protein